MRWLTDLFYLLAGLLYLPFAIYNAVALKKNRTGWDQRFGRLPDFPASDRRVWIHAVSLGEINATPQLVRQIRERVPGIEFVFTTTTDTGFGRACELYGAERVLRFPLDFSWVVRRGLEAIKPAMLVLVELEVWPNLVREAARRGVPVVVVNGRLTQRSARRLAWLGPLIRRVFGKITWVGAQDEAIASRFRALGVEDARLEVTGSVKWDTALVGDRVTGDTELAQALGLDGSGPIWVCGSTGPGEEAILLDVFDEIVKNNGGPATVRLVIIPRKPERFEEVASLIRSRGFSCVRRTMHADGAKPPGEPARCVILGDTMGELRKFYSLAGLVFIGRSLVPMGGSDPMEAAGLGKPMVTGGHFENFEQPVAALRAGGALDVAPTKEALAGCVRDWLNEPARWKTRGLKGQEIVRANQGATERTANRLVGILQSGLLPVAAEPAGSRRSQADVTV